MAPKTKNTLNQLEKPPSSETLRQQKNEQQHPTDSSSSIIVVVQEESILSLSQSPEECCCSRRRQSGVAGAGVGVGVGVGLAEQGGFECNRSKWCFFTEKERQLLLPPNNPLPAWNVAFEDGMEPFHAALMLVLLVYVLSMSMILSFMTGLARMEKAVLYAWYLVSATTWEEDRMNLEGSVAGLILGVCGPFYFLLSIGCLFGGLGMNFHERCSCCVYPVMYEDGRKEEEGGLEGFIKKWSPLYNHLEHVFVLLAVILGLQNAIGLRALLGCHLENLAYVCICKFVTEDAFMLILVFSSPARPPLGISAKNLMLKILNFALAFLILLPAVFSLDLDKKSPDIFKPDYCEF